MPGSVADLKSPRPLDEGDHLHDPVLPVTERDRPCHEVVGEGEGVVEEVKEDAQEGLHGPRRAGWHK